MGPIPPDNALKIAAAELAGYHDGFEGYPENATYMREQCADELEALLASDPRGEEEK